MSIFDRFFSRESAEKTYTVIDLQRDMDANPALPTVTEKQALRSITVMRCVTLLSTLIGTFPVDVKRKQGGQRLDVPNHPVDKAFNEAANPMQDATSARVQMLCNLLLSGNAVAKKVRDGERLVALYPLPWESARWEVKNGEFHYEIYEGSSWNEYRQADVFRISLMSIDGVTGLSPIGQTRARIGAHIKAEEYQGATYANKPMPGMVVAFPGAIAPDQKKNIEDSIAKGFTGDNAKRPLVLGGQPKVDFPSIPLTDLQWLESINAGDEQIARLFGIPPHILGIMTKSTSWGSGIEQMNIGFLQYTITPLLTMIESAIRTQLLTDTDRRSGVYARHNVASLLRSDLKSQAESLTLYHRDGIVSANEVREKLDLNPYEGGEKYVMQAQMMPVDQLGQAAGPTTEAK